MSLRLKTIERIRSNIEYLCTETQHVHDALAFYCSSFGKRNLGELTDSELIMLDSKVFSMKLKKMHDINRSKRTPVRIEEAQRIVQSIQLDPNDIAPNFYN